MTKITGQDYVGRECTLDGRKATVVGRKNRFGMVRTLDGSRSAEYSWETIKRVFTHTKPPGAPRFYS